MTTTEPKQEMALDEASSSSKIENGTDHHKTLLSGDVESLLQATDGKDEEEEDKHNPDSEEVLVDPPPPETDSDQDDHDNDKDEDDDDEDDCPSNKPTELQSYYAWFMSDVLIFVTVINMAAEFTSSVKVDSFSFSIVSGIVLKVILDLVVLIGLKLHQTFFVVRGRKILGGFLIWLVMFSSRFLILWIDDLIFGDFVDLGGLVMVLILSGILLVASSVSRILYHSLTSPCAERVFVLSQ